MRSWGAQSTNDLYASGHDQLMWQLALVNDMPKVFPPRK